MTKSVDSPADQNVDEWSGETVHASQQPKEFELEQFLPYRLSLLSNTVSEGIASDYRSHHKLSVTEWRVLAILGRFSGLTASAVTDRGAMDKVAVSRAVSKLEDKGMLLRTTHTRDRRCVTLTLSRQGVSLFNAVIPGAIAYERRLLECLDPTERTTLSNLLGRLQQQAHDLNAQD